MNGSAMGAFCWKNIPGRAMRNGARQAKGIVVFSDADQVLVDKELNFPITVLSDL